MQSYRSTLLAIALAVVLPERLMAEKSFEDRVMEVILARPEVVIAALAVVEAREEAEKAKAERERISSIVSDVFTATGDGNLADGRVPLIAEFFDYRCGYCARATAVTNAFAAANENRVRLLEFPILGAESVAIAKLAIGLRNTHGIDAYADFHTRMFEEDVQPKTAQTALRLMTSMGHDPVKVRSASLEGSVQDELQRNKAWALQVGINGTPAYLTANGVAAGMQTMSDLETLSKGTTE